MNGTDSGPDPDERNIYDTTFFIAYFANWMLVTGNALTFRFADWVIQLGGTDFTAGQIVSAGMVGALCCRLFLGRAVDLFGVGLPWSASAFCFAVGAIGMVLVDSIDAWIWIARVVYTIGLAGMFTCSMVHIQNQVPAYRRTEVIGTLGSSGFVGLITGTQASDFMLWLLPEGPARYYGMFGTAAVFGVVYTIMVVVLMRRQPCHPKSTPANLSRLLVQHWPGSVLLVAMLMGMGFTATTVFLARYATQLELAGLGTFFAAYAVSAFSMRIATRRWSRTMGRHNMILIGLCGHVLGHAILPFVTREWHFAIPAFAVGFGHALLFPCVVSLGAGAFPPEQRGTGTTIALGFMELGQLVTAPILGWVSDEIGYSTMFLSVSVCAFLVACFYWLTTGREIDPESMHAITALKKDAGAIGPQSAQPVLVTRDGPPLELRSCSHKRA